MADLTLRERKQQRAREQIIDAAYKLFAEHGFSQVTVNDIAERAEVGRTTFFRYFGDKREVVFADEDRLLEAIADAREVPGPPAATPAEALNQLWELIEPLGALVVGNAARYAEHEDLIAVNPELQDRSNRKMYQVADCLEAVLQARGTDPELALLASEVALACFRTARRLAGGNADALLPAMRRTADQVLGTP